jgi:hypothetical protein
MYTLQIAYEQEEQQMKPTTFKWLILHASHTIVCEILGQEAEQEVVKIPLMG